MNAKSWTKLLSYWCRGYKTPETLSDFSSIQYDKSSNTSAPASIRRDMHKRICTNERKTRKPTLLHWYSRLSLRYIVGPKLIIVNNIKRVYHILSYIFYINTIFIPYIYYIYIYTIYILYLYSMIPIYILYEYYICYKNIIYIYI